MMRRPWRGLRCASAASEKEGTTRCMTHRLGQLPEYGGSLKERPTRKAGSHTRRTAQRTSPVARPGNGQRRALDVKVTLVAPQMENLLDAAAALSELLGDTPEQFGAARRRAQCQRGAVEQVKEEDR